MLGHLKVDAVVVVAVRINVEPMRPDILAHERMDGPEGALADLEVLQTDVGAAVEMDQVRTHLHPLALHVAVLRGDLRRAHGI